MLEPEFDARGALALWMVLAGLVGGCTDEGGSLSLQPFPGGGGTRDAQAADAIPVGALPCDEDEDCRDGVGCTQDRCLDGYCHFIPDANPCSDGVFCNGREVCEPWEGCRTVAPVSCDDRDPCTLDRCDEASKSCLHEPRDFDGDGEVDWHCEGGTDCDDFDAARGARQPERCADGVDNDCDGDIDEASCGSVAHDTCEDALEIGGSGSFELEMRGASDDYTLGCDDSAQSPREVALRLSLDAPMDLRVDAEGIRGGGSPASVAVAVRSRCDDAGSERDCGRGAADQLRVRALPAGEHFILLSSLRAESVAVGIELREATPTPTNASCDGATDVSEGGRWESDLVDVPDDVSVRCGFSEAGDVFYSFELQQPRDVVLSALNLTNREDMAVTVRRDCDDPQSEARCMRGQPAVGRLRSLEPGRYVVAVEGPSFVEVDFAFDIAFEKPSEPLSGDACDTLEVLEPDMETLDTLTEKEDRVQTSCGFFVPDYGYLLQLEQPSDVRFELDGEDGVMSLSLQQPCVGQENIGEQPDLEDAEHFCVRGRPVSTRFRGLPAGEYAVIVEASSPTDFSVQADVSPARAPTPVEDNDTCATAVSVDDAGGFFSGDTSLMLNQYESSCGGAQANGDVAYTLELAESRRVRVHLRSQDEGFDTVLYRIADRGQGPGSCDTDLADVCNDDAVGLSGSVLDENLGAGRHYYIVDGRETDDVGAYTIDFLVSEP